jgi:hypothetical protein
MNAQAMLRTARYFLQGQTILFLTASLRFDTFCFSHDIDSLLCTLQSSRACSSAQFAYELSVDICIILLCD